MTHAEELATFVRRADWADISPKARDALKMHIVDALGCAAGALHGTPVRMVREHIRDFAEDGVCTLIGGGKAPPDRAAFYNGALVRYLDFNDSYLAEGETCHPSDNLGAVLAAAEYAGADGRTLLTALAVAYQVQCRLSDVAPVRARGFDHVTQGAFSVAAGVSKALDLDIERTANALAIAGTAYPALRVTRTGRLSHWKGLAFPNTGRSALHAAFLAMRGVTGPPEIFEGNKGWRETVSGQWDLDWSQEDLERVNRTILKKYNAEIHSQSAIEGLLELMEAHHLSADEIHTIHLATFDVAYHIIGGGEEGDKTVVRTKEEADHSLPYLLAVAALDGNVLPEQYDLERIESSDVQSLLRRVSVLPDHVYSQNFPKLMQVKLTITTKDGRKLVKEKQDYEGFHTRPMSWKTVEAKFRHLSGASASPELQTELLEMVRQLEHVQVGELTRLLATIQQP
jgi:2-methylcitrate dehydratase